MCRFALAPLLFLAVVASAFADDVVIHFSPRGGSTDATGKKQTCTDTIVEEIGRARKKILVEAYKFNSPKIAKALLAAARGEYHVKVSLILDKKGCNPTNEKFWAKYLEADDNDKIAFKCDPLHTNHNKLIVIDSKVVITGSFNFTTQAEGYAENLLVIQREDIAAKYAADWEVHWKHSKEKTFRPPIPRRFPPHDDRSQVKTIVQKVKALAHEYAQRLGDLAFLRDIERAMDREGSTVRKRLATGAARQLSPT